MAYASTTANWQDGSHFEEAIQGIKEQEQGKCRKEEESVKAY